MSPRTGRPPKNGQTKDVSLQICITKQTAETLRYCADELHLTRTEVIERGIDLVKAELDKKEE